MSSRGERGEKLFSAGYNCAQAVLLAFDDVTGLEEDTAVKISAPFGGGMAQMREVCGTVTGAFMVLGICDAQTDPKDRQARHHLYDKARAFAERFREEQGSIICGELLGLRPFPDGSKTERKKTPCGKLVRFAIELLEEELGR